MNYRIQDADIELLRDAGVSEEDITHCAKVAGKALELAERMSVYLDSEMSVRGALFHDLGKAKTHEIEHGRIGAELGKKLGLPEKITGIMEEHIRGGLTEDEARELGLPVKDYSLKGLEEKIAIYADRLVDMITEGLVPLESESTAETDFEEILMIYPWYGKNEPTLNRYTGCHEEIQNLIRNASSAE